MNIPNRLYRSYLRMLSPLLGRRRRRRMRTLRSMHEEFEKLNSDFCDFVIAPEISDETRRIAAEYKKRQVARRVEKRKELLWDIAGILFFTLLICGAIAISIFVCWFTYTVLSIAWKAGVVSGLIATGLFAASIDAMRRDSMRYTPKGMEEEKIRIAKQTAKERRRDREHAREWFLKNTGKDIGPDTRNWRDFL